VDKLEEGKVKVERFATRESRTRHTVIFHCGFDILTNISHESKLRKTFPIPFNAQVIGEFPPSTRTLQDIGNLTIVQLGREDQGVYECIASNIVTRIITATLLIVQCNVL